MGRRRAYAGFADVGGGVRMREPWGVDLRSYEDTDMNQRMIAIVLVLVALAQGAFADDAAELVKLREENAALKARVAELEAQLGQMVEALEQTKTRVVEVQAERNELAAAKAEAEQQRREYFVEREYDAGADKTRIMSRVSKLRVTKGAKYRHWFNLYAEHPGKTAASMPKQLNLVIQTSFSGTEYRGMDDVVLDVDGEAITLKVAGYDNVFRSGGSSRNRTRRDDETVMLAVPLDAARKIAKAKSVTGRMKSNTIAFERQHVEAFAAILDELEAK